MVVGADLAVALELLVEPTQRRSAIAGDLRTGVQAAATVGPVLVERQPDQRLHAGLQDPPLREQVLVLE